ncbi:MAG: apolipoprotein N-acyltransferase, partial [Desulfobacteria bacterium]
LISPDNNVFGRYDKTHLVPLGEYVPLGKYLYFIDKIVEGIGDFSSGKRIEPLESPLGKLGVFICYEGIFPDLVRKFVKKGANILVNITNDAWFGDTSAPYQHLSMVTFRAVENRVFIARAANTGISSFIDATGKIRATTEIFTKGFLIDRIPLVNIHTFYTRYGDIFAKICLGITLIIIVTTQVATKAQRHKGYL